MSEMIEFLITVRDERDNWKIKRSLADIVLLIFFARLSGAEFWEEIEDFGNIYETSLRSVLTLENGIPSHDTLQRVFATLDAQVLVEVTLMWNDILREADLSAKTFPSFAKRLLAIDAKTIEGNSSQTQKALHIVSAYATDLGICYGQVATDDKSNEITAIANKIIKKQADYCLAVKENQKGLLEDIQPFFNVGKRETDSYETIEKAHGQVETRRYEVINDTAWLRKERPNWGHIQCIGKASITIDKDGKQSEDTRYFILSCQASAKEFCAYVRGHWQIESMHWQLDVVFREDANKTLNKQLAFNLNVLDKFCLAVLKQLDVGKKMSLRRKKFNLGMNFDQYLKKLI